MRKKPVDEAIRKIVSRNLEYARAMLDVSQEELAELGKLHRNGVGSMERLETGATVDSIAFLARGIGVLPHVLLMPAREAQPIILAAVEKLRAIKKIR